MKPSPRTALRLTGLLAVLLVLSLRAFSQVPAPAKPGSPAPAFPVVDATQFGGKIDISQNWLFHQGDDPAWAAPDLDERGWTLISKLQPLSDYGFHNVRKGWYRTHIHLRPDARNATFLANNVANFALFANGRLIGSYGRITDGAPLMASRPQLIAIPDDLVQSSHGDLVIALEIYCGVRSNIADPIPPGAEVDLLTSAAAVLQQSSDLAHGEGWRLAVSELDFVIGLCGFVLWLALRKQTEYLALSVWMLSEALGNPFTIFELIHPGTIMGFPAYLVNVAVVLSMVAKIEFARLITGRPREKWIVATQVAMAATLPLELFLQLDRLPFYLASAVFIAPYIASYIILPILLVRGALRRNFDARLILLPFALWAFGSVYDLLTFFVYELTHRNWPDLPSFHIGSYKVLSGDLFDVLGLLALLLIILFRTIGLARERARFTAELAAAEQMQILLLARASHPTPGYAVESVYLPAGEVGGDFFHLSAGDDGSLLVVTGDVSGKGLRAAMAVSAVMGALRNEFSRAPATVLAHLNGMLCGHIDGFVTCSAVLLGQDGAMRVANAGNPAPYRDGAELDAAAGLPLGIAADVAFDETTSTLAPGERLVFCSDGVMEATNPQTRELFGFDRTAAISTHSASEIAHTAQDFGQTDDITVVAIERLHE
jgi:sigma-B regulation protein RsbU (phosphoserine phosphatase)